MTKHRPPLSVDAALARIAGALQNGWTEMAARTDRSESLVRAWGDPDRRERIPIDDAIVLDLAFQEAGGVGAPIYEAYSVMLDEAGALRFADRIALSQLASKVIRDCGEASASLVTTALPSATANDRRDALREVEEAIVDLTRARHQLTNGIIAEGEELP
jgi:hypothetical protein